MWFGCGLGLSQEGRGQGLFVLAVDVLLVVCILKAMGNCCCGVQDERSSRKISHSTMEPLLRESEREAVSAILKFLDSGQSEPSANLMNAILLHSLYFRVI